MFTEKLSALGEGSKPLARGVKRARDVGLRKKPAFQTRRAV